jgi:hypothetical protein
MSIEFTTAFTETPVVEFSYPVDNLQSLFDDCNTWKSESDLNGLGYTDLSRRLTKTSDKVTGSAWKGFRQSLEDAKLGLVEQFLQIDTENRWPNMPTQISKHLTVYTTLITDLTGYKMSPHIDNRSVYAAGYLNVFDNESLTVISTRQKSAFGLKKAKEYHAPGAKGQGVIWLNTDNSWHWVNQAAQNRRIILMSLQIVPWG